MVFRRSWARVVICSMPTARGTARHAWRRTGGSLWLTDSLLMWTTGRRGCESLSGKARGSPLPGSRPRRDRLGDIRDHEPVAGGITGPDAHIGARFRTRARHLILAVAVAEVSRHRALRGAGGGFEVRGVLLEPRCRGCGADGWRSSRSVEAGARSQIGAVAAHD